MIKTNKAVSPARGDFLAFRAGGRQYGIELDQVQELRDYAQVSRATAGDPALAGMLALGGRCIPVHLLHAGLEGEPAAAVPPEDVVVLYGTPRPVALAVDCVLDVVSLASSDIKPLAAPADAVVAARACSGARTLLLIDAARLIDRLAGQAQLAA